MPDKYAFQATDERTNEQTEGQRYHIKPPLLRRRRLNKHHSLFKSNQIKSNQIYFRLQGP